MTRRWKHPMKRTETVEAPWSPDTVAGLDEWQRSGHPYTGHDGIVLRPTRRGFICPCGCGYRQTWAWAGPPATNEEAAA